MVKNKKGALEFSFAWIFAIIAGMFILFLAIYGVTKFINIERSSQDAQTAKDIGILTNPLESSFETAKRTVMNIQIETRIYTGCREDSSFGKQIINTSQKTYNEWSDEGVNVGFLNKYIFSENPVGGKKFYLFSKPFEFPFKVADLIYLISTNDKYCFKDSPKNIKEEIENFIGETPFQNENFFTKDCPSGSINVCFKGGNDCNTNVNANLKYVEKNNEIMHYEGDALMYAAIFSDKKDYECQVGRLMKRTKELSAIYSDKSNFLIQKTGCDSGLNSELNQLESAANNFGGSEELMGVNDIVENIQTINDYNYVGCRLW